MKVKNLVSKDTQQNAFKSSVAYINTNSRNVFGKDIKLNLHNPSIQNEGDYRLRGNSGKIDKIF